MIRVQRCGWGVAALVLVLASCGDEGSSSIETSEQLREALEGAASGDVIELASGATFVGSFSVPGGVTVDGNGAVLEGLSNPLGGPKAVVILTGGADQATRLTDVTVVNNAGGVVAVGGGEVAIDRVTVDVSAGFGIAAEGVEALSLSELTLRGPVTEEMLSSIGDEVDPSELPIAGLMVSNVELSASELDISGFAGFGAIVYQSAGTLSASRIGQCLGVGLLVEASQLEVASTRVEESYSGRRVGSTIFATGVAVTGGSAMTSEGLTIDGVQGVGLLQDNATSAHADLQVMNNRNFAVWLQDIAATDAPAFMVRGASAIENNSGAGIFARDVAGIDLDGLTVANTATQTRVDGFRPIEYGDGVQLVGVTGQIAIRNTYLVGNPRVGLLVDGTSEGGAPAPDFALDAVYVELGELDEAPLGLIVQNSDAWDRDALLDAFTIPTEVEARDTSLGVELDLGDKFPNTFSVGSMVGDGLVGSDGFVNPEGEVQSEGVSGDVFIVIEFGG